MKKFSVVVAVSWISLLGTQSAGGENASEVAARHILDLTGVKGGLVVHLACEDGKLSVALRANDSYRVRGLDTDKDDVRRARRYIQSQGLYGEVSAAHWDARKLPFTSDLVNLVVAGEESRIDMEEMMRVLAPRGVACVKAEGKWRVQVKPWPEEMDEWTHWLHGPGNNAVAEDTGVGPPRGIQWKSGPEWARSHETRSHNLHTLVSADGRIFAIMDEGIRGQRAGVPSEWKLVARDAFNGTLLWKRPASRSGERTLVASGGKLFTTLGTGSSLAILDAATGKTLQTCTGTEKTTEILYSGNAVLCRLRNHAIVAVDQETGKVLWDRKAKAVAGNTLVAGNGRICYHTGDDLVGLDMQDGEQSWRTSCKRPSYVIMHDDIILLAGNRTEAYSAGTGKPLWKGPPRSRKVPGVFVAGGLLWSAWPQGEPHLGRTFTWEPLAMKISRNATRKTS